MAVNTRTEYALRALLEMQRNGKEAISAQKICVNQQLPKKYVEHLLGALKSAGLITSSAGSRGGYVLACPARNISLYDVMKAVGDLTLELDCCMDKQFCMGDKCVLSHIFSEIGQKQRLLFSSYTLDQIGKEYQRNNK